MAKLSNAQERALQEIRTGVAEVKACSTLEGTINFLMNLYHEKRTEEIVNVATNRFKRYEKECIYLLNNNATIVNSSINTKTLNILANAGYIEILDLNEGFEIVRLIK